MPSDRRRAKPASTKRASLPRQSSHTKQFQKDWERLSRSGRYDMVALKKVVGLIVDNDAPLPAELRDHELTGDWKDHRECHIGGDFLLIYTLDDKKNLVVFVTAGTHAELFE
ncbi:type II toxin-antitoxin system YafQ family toxin [Rhizobium mesosinicum]|uniref:Type II toxin-antitoxin system YafQ family toxin n=1 Tax=Rhizobium mesosinicum TaxID=335017 RepID=A0ABS7GXY2_9HYPH|nr:type II toxin-antitoxin system YafQ family toxin [Rhizobium mesosinicum]MBW9054848.1 type II toxin-antitoxin system YafQ family toxin [Rhizobium mesosinicum]